MASDPPIEASNAAEAAAAPAPETTEAAPAPETTEAAPAPEADALVAPAAAPAPPPAPVSKVKEWAVAVALMIVFAIICVQFITFLRSNQYGGIGP